MQKTAAFFKQNFQITTRKKGVKSFIFSSFRYENVLSSVRDSAQLMRAGASPHSQSNSPRNSPKFPPRNSSRLLSSQNGNFTTSTNLNLNGNNRRYFNNNNNDFAPPPGTPTRSSGGSAGSGGRHTATLLASLDKSILQIRDWLTLLESMIKKDRVDLANRGNIYHMLERQKVGLKFIAFQLQSLH